MPIAVTATRESLAATYTELATHASMHISDPGANGANEATGGSPAYARKPIVWNAGGTDGTFTSDPIDFDLPAGSYTHVGLWNAVTGGTYRDKGTSAVTMSTQGVYRVTLTYTQS